MSFAAARPRLGVSTTRVDLRTADGTMDTYVFIPPGTQRWPAIIFYFDAFGVRPDACDMAGRLASYGYVVALPNLYYRSSPFEPFSATTAFKDPTERARLTALIGSVAHAQVMSDTEVVLGLLSTHESVRGQQFGCVGYCFGGQFALGAAGRFPDRVVAAASIHGVGLATEQADSPHLLLTGVRARIYVALAEADPEFTPDEAARLKAALEGAGVRHAIEMYPNTRHGFAVNGRLVYDDAAAERHWRRLAEFFDDELGRQGSPTGDG